MMAFFKLVEHMPSIAVFDFDCTITTRDSLLPFFISTQGSPRTFGKLSLLAPHLIGFAIKLVSRQKVKEKILEMFCKGMSYSQLREKGSYYATHDLNRLVKTEAIERLRWHQSQGHRCILVSASLDFYLVPWALQYGFDDVISSRLLVDANGIVTGKLNGKNCWGPEKKHRLLGLLGPNDPYTLYVYGDSQGDADLLAMADFPFYRTFS